MVPEKGRNAFCALQRELREEPYDVEWLEGIINERGKQAAKTGVGFEEIQDQVESIKARSQRGHNGTLRLDMKHFGRLKPRPVFDWLELTDRRLEGYESPGDAWQEGATRFYAGFDAVIEDLLWEAKPLPLERGFETVVEEGLADRGYELADTLGDCVKWAVMYKDEEIPDHPERALIPRPFRALGEALVEHYWDGDVQIESFETYAERRGIPCEEEELLADADDGVVGVYMYVSGSTAREQGLTIKPIEGAVSRLGVFETTSDETMTNVTNLKGFYDRYPDEFAAWRDVIDVVEQTAQEFGFREIDTPSVERTELYEVKSGDELLEQTYSFEDRGERRVTMTPEQTPTRARMVQKRKDLKMPIKWVDTSKRWRYENVQKGRDREFFQTDIDVFGIESVEADAEVIACAATIYRRLDVADQVLFLVNDRNLLEALLEAEGVRNTTEVMRVVDDKEKLTTEEFLDSLAEVGVEGEAAQRVDELTSISGPITETVGELQEKAPEDDRVEEAVERMQDLSDALESYGVAGMVELDLSIVRGLAYYTGLVFEAFDEEGELRALFGGGRYDDLVGLFGDQDVPAVGFAFGYSTTRELLKREGKWPGEEVETDVYVATVSESVRDEALEIAMDLRSEGLLVETDLAGRSLGDQFSYADKVNAEQVLIVGERDLENDEVTLRDMASGDEGQVDLDRIVEEIAGD